MTAATQPQLQPGRVYRTADLARWSANPTRLAQRLVREGELVQLAHGVFVHPKRGTFGEAPPSDHELMRAVLKGAPFVFTGSARWNALGLGTTQTDATPLVYNTTRSGILTVGGRRFRLRRVAFPRNPTPEWFVVDLFQHAEQAAASRDDLERALAVAVGTGRFDRARLRAMAERYGSKDTQARVGRALTAARRAA